jgi:uracil phosphoribosyltransferase
LFHFILVTIYPHIRVVTCAVDECIDEKKSLLVPGVGVFADRYFGIE